MLGTRLPAPFTNRVQVAPGSSSAASPRVIVAVTRAERIDPEIGTRRPEVVPGSADRRRVLRLRCTVGIEVEPQTGAGRAQQLRAVDAALYALDAADFQSGEALPDAADPGFFIQDLRLVESVTPLDPTEKDAAPVGVTLRAEGWFWPVGEAGEAGVPIGEVRVRGVGLPVAVAPERSTLVAGGPPVDFTVTVGSSGPVRVDGDLPPLPFGSLAFALEGTDAGTLSGGSAGADGVRLVDVVDGAATITYTPPAAPATGELVVALDDGEEGLGVELGRYRLRVRES